MTLGQFSTAVGAPRRWVQNALAALGLPARYTVAGARVLGLARVLAATCGMPLGDAYRMAERALAAWPARERWEHVGPDRAAGVVVDLARFLSTFTARLALARTHYAERRRGRPRTRRIAGVASARAYGVDLGLVRASLARSPGERLRRLDEDVAFLRALRVRRP